MTGEAPGSFSDPAPFKKPSVLVGWPLNCRLAVVASGGLGSRVLMIAVDEV